MMRFLRRHMVNMATRVLETNRIFMSISLACQPTMGPGFLNVAINLILLVMNWSITLTLMLKLPVTLQRPRDASLVLE